MFGIPPDHLVQIGKDGKRHQRSKRITCRFWQRDAVEGDAQDKHHNTCNNACYQTSQETGAKALLARERMYCLHNRASLLNMLTSIEYTNILTSIEYTIEGYTL